jgi:hypothetical protein
MNTLRATTICARGPIIGGLLAVLLLLSATSAAAESFSVWGRVYSAYPVPEVGEIPNNPLSSVDASQIIGEDLIALTSRNLVRVTALDADDGSELGSFLVTYDGAYLIKFSDPATTKQIRLVVDEEATSKRLLFSDVQDVTASTANIRYLLVEEADGLVEIGAGRDFDVPSPTPPALYTGIFTRVGKIERQYIGDSDGLANVPTGLPTPRYQDAPFGGNLYIFGAFSQDLYALPGVCYRIKITDEADSSSRYMDSELVKTKYTVTSTGGVETERVRLGPMSMGTYSNCYELTPLASGSNVFWSFPDLLARWPTGKIDGAFTLALELVGVPTGHFDESPDFRSLKLRLSNTGLMAKILPFPDDTQPDTPRLYLPSSPAGHPSGDDLYGTPLGSFPADYGGTADPTCEILDMSGATGGEYLAFRLTAKHEDDSGLGFLRYWRFDYVRNDKVSEILIGKHYDGTSDTMVRYSPATRIDSSQAATTGFEDLFLYLDKDELVPTGTAAVTPGCGYRFVIRAATRTTDGYHHLYYDWDQDLHHIIR